MVPENLSSSIPKSKPKSVVKTVSHFKSETDGLSGPREKYFRCPYNVGLGVTTNIALDYAQKEQFDIFLRIDADGQHPLDFIPPIIEAMASREADVIVGVRSNSLSLGFSRSVVAAAIKRHMNGFANWVSGLQLDEWHSGMIVLSRVAINKLCLHEYERYPEVEILLRAVQLNLNIEQFTHLIIDNAILGRFAKIIKKRYPKIIVITLHHNWNCKITIFVGRVFKWICPTNTYIIIKGCNYITIFIWTGGIIIWIK